MKYIAKPVEVEAFKIVHVLAETSPGQFLLELDNGQRVTATTEMTARMRPSVSDYWVIQADGYIYLNPKDVFERKYQPA